MPYKSTELSRYDFKVLIIVKLSKTLASGRSDEVIATGKSRAISRLNLKFPSYRSILERFLRATIR